MDRPPAAPLAFSLDQLEVLLAVVDAGSFTQAAKRLRRAQGAISYHIAKLERRLGVELFDRAGHRPRLTPAGEAVVEEARQVVAQAARLGSTASGLAQGLEARLALSVDVLFPPATLVEIATDFQRRFPTVHLEIRSGVMGMVVEDLRAGRAGIGIAGAPELGDDLLWKACLEVELVAVAGEAHPLAAVAGPVPDEEVDRHAQLVLGDYSGSTGRRPHGFPSTTTWRLEDMMTRIEMLRAGLGWAFLPADRVTAELESGALVELELERWASGRPTVSLWTVRRPDHAAGPAGSWLLDRLAAL